MERQTALVSVCLCTYKRAHLRLTLDSLFTQALPAGVALEIVIADNDPDGSGRTLVEKAKERSPFPIHYEVEPERGISFARNRTLAMARGDWLAFIDDDEIAAPDWIAVHFETAKRLKAPVLMGIVKPRFEIEPPRWVRDSRLLERPTGPTGTPARVARTSNAFVRAAPVREKAVRFDPCYARTGGEDNDFFRRLGVPVIDNKEAVVWETQTTDRYTMDYLMRRARCMGKAQAQIALEANGMAGAIRLFLICGARSAAAPLIALALWPVDRARSRFFQIQWVKNVAKLMYLFNRRLVDFYA